MAEINIPEIDELRAELASLRKQLSEQRAILVEAVALLRSGGSAARPMQPAKMVLGIFRSGEVILMSDRRLWQGVGAPFKSYYAVRNSRLEGCPWLTTGNQKGYRISAEALERFLLNEPLRRKIS